ncbi:BatD family protein [Empedobacter tilapiae]|uniref:Protein BatD n=1 Tax=Empedobacter tilapiae TaxID=2491114 RepID=A0A4Z1BFV0_9FLAO|nr:BatD family protein [Empedobacter tilapiae]TGN26607.1 protein BatD [Empedobacter tilapiae]
MITARVFNSFLMFALTSITALAQQISFKSDAEKTQVSLGEAFSVGFFIESNTDSYTIDQPMKYPQHKGLQIVGEQRSQNVSYVNGRGIIEDGIVLAFVAEKEGKYRVGSAKIVINGKTYTSKPVDVVVKGSGLVHNNFKSSTSQPVFLQSKVSKTNPYVNEQVGLSVKLYVKDLSYLNRKQNFRQGNLDGLSPKIVKSSPENIKQEIVGGKQYFSEEIARYYVFPQKPGKIEIDPFSVDVVLPTTYGAEPVEVRSNSVVINAKALPEEGRPKNFSGAVGQFKMNASVDKKEVSTNESVNFDVEIIGTGNFNTINLPEINTPKNLEKFAPKKRDAYKTYDTGMKGKIAEQTVLVPNYGGEYTISPVEFSYFDPAKEKYITLKSDSINLSVSGSNQSNNGTTNLVSNSSSDSTISDKIDEIKNDVKEGKSGWLWLTGSVIALSLGSLFLMRKKNKLVEKNIESKVKPINEQKKVENFQSKTETQKFTLVEKPIINSNLISAELEELKQKINTEDQKDFYQLQENILCNVAMKKTNIDLAHFSDGIIENVLLEKGVNRLAVEQWKLLLNNARQAKYAFGGLNQNLDEVFEATQNVVEELMRK